MSYIALPVTAIPKDSLEWAIQGAGGMLTPLVGGVEQFGARMGDKCAVAGPLGLLDRECARAWVAALRRQRATGTPVRWTLPTPYGMAVGTPLVAGAGQAGLSLDVDGLTPDLVIPMDTPFNVHDAYGRPYLHFLDDDVTVDGSGAATLVFSPMLRRPVADNGALEFAAPKMEGWLNDCGVNWTVERLEFHSVPFALREAR